MTDRDLTSIEAKQLLTKFGANEPGKIQRAATIFQILSFLANPLVIIPLIASIISGALGC